MILEFPEKYKQHRYNNAHFSFIIDCARTAGIAIIFKPDSDKIWVGNDKNKTRHANMFSCILDNKQIIIDFMDFAKYDKSKQNINIPYFKMHSDPLLNSQNNIFPIGPSILYPRSIFKEYLNVINNFKFKCSNNEIKNKQKPRGQAKQRRTKIQILLKKNFKNIDINYKSTPLNFWKEHENCLVSICVPGANNNMLDRGQLELMGLGVCTISPNIPTKISWNKQVTPDVHYLRCKDDYSDLVKLIKWCMNNKKECENIGGNAKELFSSYLMPNKYWEWIEKCSKEFYNE